MVLQYQLTMPQHDVIQKSLIWLNLYQVDLSDLYQAMQERATKIFAKFVKEKKCLLLKAGWFDQEISSFVNFHLVN